VPQEASSAELGDGQWISVQDLRALVIESLGGRELPTMEWVGTEEQACHALEDQCGPDFVLDGLALHSEVTSKLTTKAGQNRVSKQKNISHANSNVLDADVAGVAGTGDIYLKAAVVANILTKTAPKINPQFAATWDCDACGFVNTRENNTCENCPAVRGAKKKAAQGLAQAAGSAYGGKDDNYDEDGDDSDDGGGDDHDGSDRPGASCLPTPTVRMPKAHCHPLGCLSDATSLLSKMSIVRDYYQILSLFISKLAARSLRWLQGVASFAALNFPLTFNVGPKDWKGITTTLAVFALIFLACICACARTDALSARNREREGAEFENWASKAARLSKTILSFQYLLMGMFTAYLPLSQYALESAVCWRIHKCDSTNELPVWLAVFILLFITVGLPFWVAWLIEKNKPVGSLEDPKYCFDDDGNKTEYTVALYQRDLLSDNQVKNPYSWLYKAYGKNHAQYKVFSELWLKFLLVVPVVLVPSIGAMLAKDNASDDDNELRHPTKCG
jgi:hypothetical protein